MSSNIVVTKGHHTCSAFRNEAVAKERAPFKSCCSEGKSPFLGEGFYFWDDNIEIAHWWGKTHYNNKYTILQYDFTLEGDSFLDLVGSRQDIYILLGLRKKLIERGDVEEKDLSVSKCIELLKKIERNTPGVFPYTIIRAMDIRCKTNGWSFVNDKRRCGTLITNPRIIICFFCKKDIPLRTAEVVKL